jgi:dienelactone hydrolase
MGWVAAPLIACGGDGGPPPQVTVPPETHAEVLSELPETPDPDRRYIIYLHNLWLENRGPGVPHPEFGDYEFEEILQALAEPGLTVIGEVRPRGADPHSTARRVADQVATLQNAGVPADQITVVGFSKGGAIAILASALIADDEVNFVFLAACGGWLESTPNLVPHGRLLSIRETSDEIVASCDGLFARVPPSTERHEITLSLGGGHGAFFRPHASWIQPVVRWAAADDPS